MVEIGFENCRPVSDLRWTAPSPKRIQRVLKENGFAAEAGSDILAQHYGLAFQPCDCEFTFTAFLGFHTGLKTRLMSAYELWFRHVVMRDSMNSGFLGREGCPEYTKFKEFERELCNGIDVVGVITWVDGDAPPSRSHLLRPGVAYWLAVTRVGWIAIDVDYWLMNTFDSLHDLLCWRDPREFVAAE